MTTDGDHSRARPCPALETDDHLRCAAVSDRGAIPFAAVSGVSSSLPESLEPHRVAKGPLDHARERPARAPHEELEVFALARADGEFAEELGRAVGARDGTDDDRIAWGVRAKGFEVGEDLLVRTVFE